MKSAGRFALYGVGFFVLLALVFVAFGAPVGLSFQRIAEGALATEAGQARTLVKMTPLLLTGLGVLIAWRAGMFNIGGEGQFVMGGLLAMTFAILAKGAPAGFVTVMVLVGSAVGGGLYAYLAAWLQIRRGVQVVISTILLNFIALQCLDGLVRGPLRDPVGGLPQSAALPEAAMLTRFNRQTDLHIGVFLALLMAVIVWIWLSYRRGGYQTRLVGANPRAARAALIPTERIQARAMMISGALCGLAGGVELAGISGRLDAGFDQQWGFLAIPVALLGMLHPLGVVGSSLVFGVLFAGSQNMARVTPGGDRLIFVIQGVAVLAYLALQAIDQRKRWLQTEAV